MKIKYICKLCNKEFDGTRNFTGHLKLHKISSREYYDKFLKKPDKVVEQSKLTISNEVEFMDI